MADETDSKRQTHIDWETFIGPPNQVWRLDGVARECGCSTSTALRTFGGLSWVSSLHHPNGAGKPMTWSLQNSIGAYWGAHTAEVSKNNAKAANTRWRLSCDDD